MRYAVRIIGDDDLPAEIDWAFVRTEDTLTLCLKESRAASARVLAEVWGAFLQIESRNLLPA